LEFSDSYAEALRNGVDREVDALTSPDTQVNGDRAVYRAIFRGMEVHGLPSDMIVGHAHVFFTQGPVLTQHTEVSQRGGFPLIFDKSMKRGVEIGKGQWLTVVQIHHQPMPEEFGMAITSSRDQARAAVAYIAAVLDERIGQELLGEDLIIFDQEKAIAAVDIRELVRSYPPFEVREAEQNGLAALEGVDVPRHVETASRWYLRGVQAAPGVDGVIFLWFAVEALVGTSKKTPIEKALREAGHDPADQGLGVGELHGLRSKFVHDKPDAQPPAPEKVKQAFYDLEAMAKALLRHALGVTSTWPLHTAAHPFDPPWLEQIEEAWANPVVEFHEELPGSKTVPIEGLSWSQMAPALDLAAAVTVRGGQGQDANRIRRLVEMALLYFGDPHIGDFPVEIKRLPEGTLADCEEDLLIVNSTLVSPRDPLEASRLFINIHVFVGRCLLSRVGVPSDNEEGWFLHGILTGCRLLSEANVPDDQLKAHPLPGNYSSFDLGEQFGAGAAGSHQNLENARAVIAGQTEAERATATAIFEQRIRELEGPADAAELLMCLKAIYNDA
jgi:hypothetical protein